MTEQQKPTVKDSLSVPTTEDSSVAQMHYDGKPVDATPVHDNYHPSDGPVVLLGLELRARRAEARAFTLANEHMCLTLKLDTAEKRIAELEREAARLQEIISDDNAFCEKQAATCRERADRIAELERVIAHMMRSWNEETGLAAEAMVSKELWHRLEGISPERLEP